VAGVAAQEEKERSARFCNCAVSITSFINNKLPKQFGAKHSENLIFSQILRHHLCTIVGIVA